MFLNRCYENEDNMMQQQGQMPVMGGQMPAMGGQCMSNQCGCTCPPVMECPQERVCHTQTCYEVPHIIPINTRVINHHIYRHTYQPMYTCTSEDEVCNVYDNKCGF